MNVRASKILERDITVRRSRDLVTLVLQPLSYDFADARLVVNDGSLKHDEVIREGSSDTARRAGIPQG